MPPRGAPTSAQRRQASAGPKQGTSSSSQDTLCHPRYRQAILQSNTSSPQPPSRAAAACFPRPVATLSWCRPEGFVRSRASRPLLQHACAAPWPNPVPGSRPQLSPHPCQQTRQGTRTGACRARGGRKAHPAEPARVAGRHMAKPSEHALTFGALTASATTWGALTSFLAESLKEERQVRVVPSRSGKPKATINILMLDRTTHQLLECHEPD